MQRVKPEMSLEPMEAPPASTSRNEDTPPMTELSLEDAVEAGLVIDAGKAARTRFVLGFAVAACLALIALVVLKRRDELPLAIAVELAACVVGTMMAVNVLRFGPFSSVGRIALAFVPFVNAVQAILLHSRIGKIERFDVEGHRRKARSSLAEALGLKPVHRPPSLTTVNTLGFALYGKTEHDPRTDSYMMTHYLVALFLPLCPVARYRVIVHDGGGYQFLGKGSLRMKDRVHMAVFFLLIGGVILAVRAG